MKAKSINSRIKAQTMLTKLTLALTLTLTETETEPLLGHFFCSQVTSQLRRLRKASFSQQINWRVKERENKKKRKREGEGEGEGEGENGGVETP